MKVANKHISLLSGIEEELLESRHSKLMIKSMPEISRQLYPDNFTDEDFGFGFHETGVPITRHELEMQLKIREAEKLHYTEKLKNIDYINENIRERNHIARKDICELKAMRKKVLEKDLEGTCEYDEVILDLRMHIAEGNDILANIPHDALKTRNRLEGLIGKDAPEDFVPNNYYFAPLYWDKKCARNEYQVADKDAMIRREEILGKEYVDSVLNNDTPFTVRDKRIRDLEIEIRKAELHENGLMLPELQRELVNILGKDTMELYKKRAGSFLDIKNLSTAHVLIIVTVVMILLHFAGFYEVPWA